MPAVGSDWLTALGHDGAVYVVPEFRVVYVMIAKNACTTLKWAIAELAREDVANFRSGLNAFTADEHAVHDRSQFRNALHPDEVDPAVRADIHPDNGWFIFGAVRDPRERLFSAWQDKLLLQDPAYRRLQTEPWYPSIPADAEAVVEQFARFVDAASSAEFQLHTDLHFTRQTDALSWGAVPYSQIYSVERLEDLHQDLLKHAQALGWAAPLEFRRTNETPLKANAAVFAGPVRAQIETMFAPDFEAFGEFWDFAKFAQAPEWSAAAVREVRVRGLLGRRLGDLRAIALQQQARANAESERAAQLERELNAARHDLRAGHAELLVPSGKPRSP